MDVLVRLTLVGCNGSLHRCLWFASESYSMSPNRLPVLEPGEFRRQFVNRGTNNSLVSTEEPELTHEGPIIHVEEEEIILDPRRPHLDLQSSRPSFGSSCACSR
jgi:hypothetical protein